MTSQIHNTDINLVPLLAGLEQPLQLVSDPEARQRFEAYVNAARPQVERAAFDLLSTVVASFNAAGTYQRASLEYAGGAMHVRIEDTQEAEPETTFNDGDLERVTIRLPKELKELIDAAAERHGMSANNWYVRALARAISRHSRDGTESHEGRHERRRRGFYRGRGGGGQTFADDVKD